MVHKVPKNTILIDSARVKAVEEDYGDDHGKSQEFFIKALREACNRLNMYLVKTVEQIFATSIDIDGDGTNNYLLPTDIFSDQHIYNVWYSYNGEESSFEPLSHYPRRFFNTDSGDPDYYAIYGGRLWLNTAIRAGAIVRVEYEEKQPLPDLPRGTIFDTNFAIANGLPIATVIQLDTATVSAADAVRLAEADFICLQTNRGVRTAEAIEVCGYDSGTGRFSLCSSVLPTGSVVNIGDVVTIGQKTTTHLPYDIICESFLLEYLRTEAELQDSSIDYEATKRKLDVMLAEIASTYQGLPSGPTRVPQLGGL